VLALVGKPTSVNDATSSTKGERCAAWCSRAVAALKELMMEQAIGRPDEIAVAVFSLCRTGARFVIAYALAVDGGC
jgi:hypothetical protein